MQIPEARLQQIREVLAHVRHIAIATVNMDGTPHNSPVFSAYNNQLEFVWASHPESVHSQNIARTGHAFIVVFDSVDKGGGLYIEADAKEVLPAQLQSALATFNMRREQLLKEVIPASVFTGTQQLYCAKPQKIWINMAERGTDGRIVQDHRYEVKVSDIIQ
jgi:hypothetical protein